jgi:hypothetical protein
MIKEEQDLIDLVENGQSGKYSGFARYFSGGIQNLVELKNPLSGSVMIDEINRILDIINPKLKSEIEWFKKVQSAIKLWCNEKVITNRILGINNDNEYDLRVFENVVKEKFFMQLHGKKISHDTLIETDFKTMVEMVELGMRRFKH